MLQAQPERIALRRELRCCRPLTVLVKEALELLVGHINAKLLKAILIKVLKAKDVKDANLVQLFLLPGCHACRAGTRGGGM